MVMLPGALSDGTTGSGLCSPKRLTGGSFSVESARNNWVTPADSITSLLGGESRFDDHAASVPLLKGVNGRTGAAGAGADVWKSWVKLPSADAESDTPGVENPFNRGVAGGANAAGSDPVGRFGIDAVAATNIRVNSPGSWRNASGDGRTSGAELACGVAGDGANSSL